MRGQAAAIGELEDSRALRAYFDDIGHAPLLTPEEERDLAHRNRRGDRDAARRLVECNLRFVVSIAKKYQNQGVPLADLISEGNLGLLRATRRFDLKFGVRFISYAVWWIRQAINSALHEQRNLVHIPLNRSIEHSKVAKSERYLSQRLGRPPTPFEIARDIRTSVAEVDRIRRNLPGYSSLDAPVGDEDDKVLGDLVEDTSRPRLEEQIFARSMRQDVYRSVHALPDRERKVVEMRFGLNGYVEMTLEQVGLRLRLSRERIRQIEQKALRRLRNPFRNGHLREHLVS